MLAPCGWLNAEVHYDITLVALEGQPAPGQAGTFKGFSYPVLNSRGQVAFIGDYLDGLLVDAGIYLWSSGSLQRIADQSMSLPQDPLMPFFNFGSPVLNNAGKVVFNANSGYQGGGAYSGGDGPLSRVASIGTAHSLPTPVPGHPDRNFGLILASALNDNGTVTLTGQAGPYRSLYTDSGGGLSIVCDTESSVPGQPGAEYWLFESAAVNSRGDVAFRAQYTDGVGNEGLYIQRSGTLEVIADGTTVPPGQSSPFTDMFVPSLNDAAQIAFSGHGTEYRGDYLWTDGLLEDIAPSLSGGFGYPRINNDGLATFLYSSGGSYIVRAHEGVAEFVAATGGTPVPGQPEAGFTGFADPSINGNSAVAFRTRYYTGGSYRSGLYTDFRAALTKVVDHTDVLVDGLTASDVQIVYDVDPGGRSPFNDGGQVAFWAQLTDGRAGIFLATPIIEHVEDAKLAPDSFPVQLQAISVTAAFPDFFYIEADTRESGIRVEKPGHGLTAGMRADVEGTVGTNADGERYIDATSAVQNGTGSVDPLGMPDRSLGGGDWQYDPITGAGQKGIAGAYGLNNIGLLARVWGRVTQRDTTGLQYFYIDDGSAIEDGTQTASVDNVGIRIIADPTPYPEGSYVTITGISSCFKDGSGYLRRKVLPTP